MLIYYADDVYKQGWNETVIEEFATVAEACNLTDKKHKARRNMFIVLITYANTVTEMK